ncbi:plasmid partition protein ParG [Iningainema tapete]|uniref:Chromosome partitioning protein ParB n=1 Tax=Iningainema tapete BLCC-T55 TaxID=2748662 RepID=A0A8J6XG19_9CYAN|nr:plasmid partition protein ParG [Iningainema tapete]MBD2770959.1 chromosome partitioning protein ParB [Iningainema tapete BLCC-T55]
MRLEEIMAKLPPNMTELSSYVDKDLKLRFKLACTAQQKTMSEVITELIEEWLEENENPSPALKGKGEA